MPYNSIPIKIYEFVLKPILDYVSVYEASHESYTLQLNLAIAPHNNNKTGHISPFLSKHDSLLAITVATSSHFC